MLRYIGTYLGIGMAGISLAGLTGTPITGGMIVRYMSYTQATIFSGVSVLVGASWVVPKSNREVATPLSKTETKDLRHTGLKSRAEFIF